MSEVLVADARRTGSTRSDERERRILDAARDAFRENGFAATSMDRVANRARVSKTTLYTRFPSKEALFAAAIARECEERGMRFKPEEFDGLPVEEALNRIGRRFLDLLMSGPAIRVTQIVTGEAARFPDLARIFYDAGPGPAIACVAAYLARARDKGELAIEDPTFAAGQLLQGLKGMAASKVELGLCTLMPPADQENACGRRRPPFPPRRPAPLV